MCGRRCSAQTVTCWTRQRHAPLPLLSLTDTLLPFVHRYYHHHSPPTHPPTASKLHHNTHTSQLACRSLLFSHPNPFFRCFRLFLISLPGFTCGGDVRRRRVAFIQIVLNSHSPARLTLFSSHFPLPPDPPCSTKCCWRTPT